MVRIYACKAVVTCAPHCTPFRMRNLAIENVFFLCSSNGSVQRGAIMYRIQVLKTGLVVAGVLSERNLYRECCNSQYFWKMVLLFYFY